MITITIDKSLDKKELFGYNKEDILHICLSSIFPGDSKWEPTNPIWDCYLPGNKSPREAWNDKEYLMKAINNMFWILHKCINENKDLKLIENHCKAFELSQLYNNHTLLCKLVLRRFTIAKIAPKVTAIQPSTVYKIILESNIDISNGVYCPMAGFGGIIEGVKRWFKERSLSYEDKIESYDINPIFVKYFNYDGVRDMLHEVIKTDKTVICCPPFGKSYEHWKGTPDSMSDISFLKWYKYIKEYIKSPNYIIIGPELNINSKHKDNTGKEYNALFKRKNGVQLWNDELYNTIINKSKEDRKKEGIKN